jgi:hypothetical protein
MPSGDVQQRINEILKTNTLRKKGILLLSETLLGFPSDSETQKEFPIVTNTFF